MAEQRFVDRVRDWLGARAFRLTCWLYRLDPAQTVLDAQEPKR